MTQDERRRTNVDDLLFGTGGVPISSPKPSTEAGLARLRELGLDCMELEWVQKVSMGPETAQVVRRTAEQRRIHLTVHAPYYINLNSKEPDKLQASKQRLLAAARVGALCGAASVAFHPAFYHDDPPAQVYATVKHHLAEIMATLYAEGLTIQVRPETTGKDSQFGSVEEILRLSQEIAGVFPCIDFSHLHARHMGKMNTYAEFAAILADVRSALGSQGLSDMHIHLSGIAYGPKGEREHLVLAEADLNYAAVLQALKDAGAHGVVVCESPNLEEDALVLQKTYRQL